MQYYNSLFPPITSISLPAFNTVPQSRNSYTNANEINFLKFPFYHSIANIRSQYNSIVMTIVRSDNNSNPVDKKIFNSGHIFFRAKDKRPENDVITDKTGETYLKLPVSYFLTYDSVANSLSALPAASDNSLGFVFDTKKAYIRKSGAWQEISEKNYNYPSLEDIGYKIQIRLMPYEVRQKASDKKEWEALVNGNWLPINDAFFTKNRDFISEYSTITSVRPTYPPSLEIIGGFKETSSNGAVQRPVYNPDDTIVGDGVNDSINILTSSFFEFTGSFFNQYDITETIARYKFIVRYKQTANPLADPIFDESPYVIVDTPESPTIKWQNKREYALGQFYWIELKIETKNGFTHSSIYWVEARYSKILGSAGLQIKPVPDTGKVEVLVDGTQILFIPENGERSHIFVGENEAKFVENYVTSRNINLSTASGQWCSQMKVSGVNPDGKVFLTIKTPDIDPSTPTQYVYELSAFYEEQIIEQTISTSKRMIDNVGDRFRIYVYNDNRITFKEIYTDSQYETQFPVKDAITPETYWMIKMINGRLSLESTTTVTENVSVDFARYNDFISMEVHEGRIVLEGDTVGKAEIKIFNQFTLKKTMLRYDSASKRTEEIISQSVVARFINPITNQFENFEKINENNDYYFYVGDNQGYLSFYVAQKKLDGTNIPSYENR